MKKNYAILITLLLITLALCACASPEKTVENIIKQQTGQDVDIKDGGNSITIKGENGESMTVTTGDDQKWPAGKLGDLPELKGTVKSIVEAGGTCFVSLEDVSEADARDYISKLKELGYADGIEATDEVTHSFVFAGSKDGCEISLRYYPEGGSKAGMSSVDISYTSNQQE